jgi:DNA-binding transcriptional LysR family regulator
MDQRTTTRTLSPTSEGAAYYEHVAAHLRAIEEAEDIMQAPGNVRGVLRSPCQRRSDGP